MFGQGLTQVRERLAQALAGAFFWLFGPKQAGKTFAAVRTIIFERQVDQQGTRFIGGKPGQGLATVCRIKSAEEVKGEHVFLIIQRNRPF